MENILLITANLTRVWSTSRKIYRENKCYSERKKKTHACPRVSTLLSVVWLGTPPTPTWISEPPIWPFSPLLPPFYFLVSWMPSSPSRLLTILAKRNATSWEQCVLHTMINSSRKVVSDQRYPCPAFIVCDLNWGGAGQRPQRGQSPVEHRGICLSLRPSVPPSVCPLCPILRVLSSLGPILT